MVWQVCFACVFLVYAHILNVGCIYGRELGELAPAVFSIISDVLPSPSLNISLLCHAGHVSSNQGKVLSNPP